MLGLQPITLREANRYIADHHRHHGPVQGCKFCVAVNDGERIRGVAVVGRPVARHLDDGWTAEVTRCCTDGARNAASMLYGACARAAKALGYQRVITYTLPDEGGASLRGAGWHVLWRTQRHATGWHTPSRPRINTDPQEQKLLWEA